MIREYFLNYNEALSNDFTLSDGGRTMELHRRDVEDWRITFVDTGLHSNIGQRLLRVRRYLGDDSEFLANYSDGLSNVPLDLQLKDFGVRRSVASFVAVASSQSFHVVRMEEDGLVSQIGPMSEGEVYINGGFFIFRREIFDYIHEGEELVEEPFRRLIAERKLSAFRWSGFWRCMDTFKDKISFDRMEARGECPWMVWRPAS
jgi:glucose-1-phosphate cytidylyltransferase